MASLESSFKKHIAEFKLDLGSKAGITRKEVQELSGLEKIHKMSSNENPLGPSPKALEAIQNAMNSINEYGYKSDFDLTNALAKHFDYRLTPKQFFVRNGGIEVLELIFKSFLYEDRECIVTSPSFHIYEMLGALAGGEVRVSKLKDNFTDLDLDQIFSLITDQTRLIILNSPNNPVGTILPKAQIDILIDNIPDHVVVVMDEVYYHFATDDNFAKAIDYIEQGKNVIGVHSFSKAYGLAGIRLGYGFSTKKISDYLRNTNRPFAINTLSTDAGIAALNDIEHLERTLKTISEGKFLLFAAFKRLGVEYFPSQTNFILFRSPGPVDALINYFLQHGIMIRSGEINGAKGCIRLTIGRPESNEAFVRILEKYLSE